MAWVRGLSTRTLGIQRLPPWEKLGSAYVVCLEDSCAPSLDSRKERCEVIEHSKQEREQITWLN